MKIIDTRIETMQIELLEASKEITTDEECLGFLLFDVLKGKLYIDPEDAISNKGGSMLRMAMADNCNFDCDGSTFLRVSVVVDAFSRDKDEPRFSICDKDEVNDAITNHRAMNEQEANKDDGFTRLEGLPFKANKLVYHLVRNGENPEPNRMVIVLTDNGCWFSGMYEDGLWKYADGKLFYSSDVGGYIVAWFEVPVLKKA